MSRGENPAAVDEHPSTDVPVRQIGVLRSDLQGHLPWVGCRQRLQPSINTSDLFFGLRLSACPELRVSGVGGIGRCDGDGRSWFCWGEGVQRGSLSGGLGWGKWRWDRHIGARRRWRYCDSRLICGVCSRWVIYWIITVPDIAVVPPEFVAFSEEAPGHSVTIWISAMVVVSQSILIVKVLEGVGAGLQDEVGVPVKTLVTVVCLTHVPSIRLPVISEAVIRTDMAEASTEPLRTVAVEVIAISHARPAILARIRLAH